MSELGALADLIDARRPADLVPGMTVGIVTNNQDPAGLGRVKVKFPWLSDADESHWARLVTPMAGAQRGVYFLPDVDDEVLVAFEHGRIDFPYVLGGLWNGKDQPPESDPSVATGVRIIKSKSGHTIRLDDRSGQEQIEIADSKGNRVTIDTAKNAITISAEADVTIESRTGKLKLSGQEIEVSSSANCKVAAGANLNLEGTAQTTLKGAAVAIN